MSFCERKKEKARKREKKRERKKENQSTTINTNSLHAALDPRQEMTSKTLVHGVSALLQPEPPPASGFISLCEAVAMQRTSPSELVPVTTRALGVWAVRPFGSTLGVWGCLTGWAPIDPFPFPLFVGDRSREVKLKCAGTAPHCSFQPWTGLIHRAPRSHD